MGKTIHEVVSIVLEQESKPLTPKAIYRKIVDEGLYNFRADDPVHVVRSQIRRRCEGLDFASARPDKKFRVYENGTYGLKSWGDKSLKEKVQKESLASSKQGAALASLKAKHNIYLDDFSNTVLEQLKELTPSEFEAFSTHLLKAYGLTDLRTTPKVHDGGVDGEGVWEFGTAELNVKVQCKRWKSNTVNRPEVDKFRGSVQGECELGIFITTALFSKGAEAVSFKPGAVPIILIDGPGIVDIMLDNEIGIERKELPYYVNVLDTVISEEE